MIRPSDASGSNFGVQVNIQPWGLAAYFFFKAYFGILSADMGWRLPSFQCSAHKYNVKYSVGTNCEQE
jgi:hypothetical protein